ncbi:hypothetical protein [Neoaquamicrobium sediminum]|jgi:hypothetical protein|uniref:Uncharacterized protein n=1 Tax=Neoaquamicrobium sediminum TaxID=1849104 RepID=A0ABV3WY83_9HYPH|nr:hypothetical protein [Mesorhizobium sediminum]MBX9451844.1 hypothetical protein [Mesorhizobium sp.]NRC55957.1 hypothetical protein [Mesorhizobium sediminum]
MPQKDKSFKAISSALGASISIGELSVNVCSVAGQIVWSTTEMDVVISSSETRSLSLAALYICQSLLLELEETGRIDHDGVQGLLKDAANALRQSSAVAAKSQWMEAGRIVDAMRLRHDRLSVLDKPG